MFGSTSVGGEDGRGTIFELTASKGGGWKHRVIWSFHQSDGDSPVGNLIRDSAGDIYGTTIAGGIQNNAGVAFELMPDARRKKWKIRILYNFCAKGGVDCSDGQFPKSGLTYAAAASGVPYDGVSPLYGTTSQGGAGNGAGGALFELTPSGKTWREKIVYDFCVEGDCLDGGDPAFAGPAFDASGHIFGTLAIGGPVQDNGTVYELNSRTGKKWALTTLYNFCVVRPECSDGADPTTGVIIDASGAMFGTTEFGGPTDPSYGTVFKLARISGSWQESVLYTFCTLADCIDGSNPEAAPIMDSSGNLFGTTQWGGGNDIDGSGLGGGTVFEISGSSMIPLYSFCAQANCTDGEYPIAPLAIDASGNLFGTTSQGGPSEVANAGGTVFELTP
jgi:hypothetical protein